MQTAGLAVGLVGGRGRLASDVVAVGGFDLEDVGAEVGEQLAGVGCGDSSAVFEDGHAVECGGRSG